VLSSWQVFSGQTRGRIPQFNERTLFRACRWCPIHNTALAQATKCRGDLALIVASDYLMQAAGALSALDSESKISPLSSPLGTSPGS